jgi:hypothetical protein
MSKATIVSMKSAGVCSHHNYSIPPQPGAGLEDILRVLFQDVSGLERAAIPDSGAPISSANLKEKK